jgi:copper(I)-binding protein
VGTLDISQPWSRPTANDVTVAGGYLAIPNQFGADVGPAAGPVDVEVSGEGQ